MPSAGPTHTAPLLLLPGDPLPALPGIEAIADRRRPTLDGGEAEVVYDFCTEYYATHRIGDALYARAVQAFDEKGVAELVGIMGYYGLVAMTLNVFEMSLPEGEPEPLSP